MEKTVKNAMDIIKSIQSVWGDGSCVPTSSGARWRVTNPEDNSRTAFVPIRLADKLIQPQLDRLRNEVGWDPELVKTQKEVAARRRTAANQKALNQAEARATAARQEAEANALRIEAASESHRETLLAATAELAASATQVGGVRFDTVMLDAAFAKELLHHNRAFVAAKVVQGEHTKTNRPLHRMDDLLAWARDMVNGKWLLVPHGIALDKDGNLLDGQNRLTALGLAQERWRDLLDPRLPDYQARFTELARDGVTIPMVVSYDWDPAVYDRIDRGRPRTLTDLLAVTGHLNRHLVAATTRLVYFFQNDPDTHGWKYKVSEHELLALAERLQPKLGEACMDGRLLNQSIHIVPSGAAAALFVCRQAWPQTEAQIAADGNLHQQFFEGLRHEYTVDPATGRRLPLAEKDPRLALIRFLRLNLKKERRHWVHMGMLIKTWNKWVQGRQAELIKLGPAELFPQPVTPKDSSR